MRVFDLVQAKLTGEVVDEDNFGVCLRHPCTLEISLEPVKGGESFNVKVAFRPLTLVGEVYRITTNAIRGESYLYEPALLAGYAEFRMRAERGDYRLGPYRPTPEVVYSAGSSDGVQEDLGTLSSSKESGDANG